MYTKKHFDHWAEHIRHVTDADKREAVREAAVILFTTTCPRFDRQRFERASAPTQRILDMEAAQ